MNTRPIPRRALLLGAAGLPLIARPAAAWTIGDLYGDVTADGLQLSPGARAQLGRRITVTGYMAPPLKAESDFFVLTRFPMSVCPFCSNAADWPTDIVVINLTRASDMLGAAYAIEVSGVLEYGAKIDPGTGFVSLVRLVEARWRRV